MSQEEKKGRLVLSLNKESMVIIDDHIEIRIQSKHAKIAVGAKLIISAPKNIKITKVKRD